MERHVEGLDVVIIAIAVLFVGKRITAFTPFLQRNNIPAAVTGGILCSLLVAAAFVLADITVTFDMHLRDLLLLIFFSTIGLSAKFRLLLDGGKALAILVAAAGIFLIVQDVTGVLLVKLIGGHPAYGLFGGSISFAGGYGTAIAWGEVATEAGLEHANAVGMACATFGLIAGGMLGGPVAQRLIDKHGLSPSPAAAPTGESESPKAAAPVRLDNILGTIMLLAICVQAGDIVNSGLAIRGFMLPGFLTAMLVGIVLTNAVDLLKRDLCVPAIEYCAEFSLQLFLAISLMSMQLHTLFQSAGPILLILLAQVIVMTLFATHIVFRLMGKSYDACVIAAGFTGLGLGATPVAIANMNAVTTKYGPSPKAFLVVPLVGAFFIDLMNAVVIKAFAALPLLAP
jgi:ESS family glutamate:Na+ symporter